MKNIIILALLLLSIVGFGQIPFPLDNQILKDMQPIKLDDVPEVEQAELLYDIIELQQEEDETEKLRIVFWLHGLSGNGASWSNPAQASESTALNTQNFQARYIHSHLFDYSDFTDGSLYTAANHIRTQLRATASSAGSSFENDRTRNFIIAHSQGGMVSRQLLNMDVTSQLEGILTDQERGYGGLVTVASPLQGAQILNNQGMILQMADDACTNLTEGPLLTNVTNFFPLTGTIIRHIGRTLIDLNVCEMAAETALPLLFSDKLASITNDYYVESSKITTFNNDVNNPYYTSIPKVAFYGVEPYQNILWRTVRWIDEAPHHEDVWQANNDYKFYDEQIAPMYWTYQSNFANYEEKWDAYYWVPALRTYYLNRMKAWRNGRDWLNNANSGWEAVIGALEYEFVGFNGLWPQIDITRYESDGVVTTGSAMNMPGATHEPVRLEGIYNIQTQQWTGSSHMQIRNDGALEDRLNKLYDGQYGWFFYTKTK